MRSRVNIRLLLSLASVFLFACILCWFLIAVNNTQNASNEQRLEALRTSVDNSITLCYSIEGAYPENIEYLIEHYGVRYDKTKYIVHYDCFASNIRPNITIIERVQ